MKARIVNSVMRVVGDVTLWVIAIVWITALFVVGDFTPVRSQENDSPVSISPTSSSDITPSPTVSESPEVLPEPTIDISLEPTPPPTPTPVTSFEPQDIVVPFDGPTEPMISFIPMDETPTPTLNMISEDLENLEDLKDQTAPIDVVSPVATTMENSSETESQEQNDKNIIQKTVAVFSDAIEAGIDTVTELFNRQKLHAKLRKGSFLANERLELEIQGKYEDAAVTLSNSQGQVLGVRAQVVDQRGKKILAIEKPHQFVPGRYHLKITQADEDVIDQDFTWGVLAMNTNKSVYSPGELARLAFAVLDDQGEMVCDALLQLNIHASTGKSYKLSTEDGSIRVNPECEQHGFTQKPDYEAEYTFGEIGHYEFELTAETEDGTRSVSETIDVSGTIKYDVERFSATRIYPPDDYSMTIKIKPKVDFTGIIEEKIPLGFEVLDVRGRTISTRTDDFDGMQDSLTMNLVDLDFSKMTVTQREEYQTIEWQVSLKKDDELELRYVYDVPDISPQFYLLGPLSMRLDSPGEIEAQQEFVEARSWQLAADALANFSFVPTGGGIVTGSNVARLAATAAVNTGVNVGSWQGTLADDNIHWSVAGAGAAGHNFYLDVDGVQLNGANKFLIQTEIDTDAALTLRFQICDWVSTTDVDAGTDAQCTGGGWRSLNSQTAANADVIFTGNGVDALQWHVYDGYWSTGATGGTPVSTPLSNFVQAGNNRFRLRFYSTTNSTTNIDVDFLRVVSIVDSVYHAADFTNLGTGTVVGTYANTQIVGNIAAAQQTVTTGNAISLDVGGLADSPADFYLLFKNIKTYTGMNTIYVKADYRCSVASNTHRPKIWNFNLSQWEDLTTASIACTTADATSAWAKNNVTIADYVSGGEARIGWRTLANGTERVRLDYLYVILGTTNTDSSRCEITFGTGTATNCSNTRDLDVTGSTNTWSNPAQDESNNHDKNFYGYDSDSDGVVEEATAANLDFPVTLPDGAAMVGVNYAGRFAAGTPGATALTVQMGLKDYSGAATSAAGVGGWTQVGATSASATSIYTDSITAMTVANYGMQNNAENFVNISADQMNVRLRTTSAGTATTNTTTEWDFAMVSLMWRENAAHPSVDYQYATTSGSLITGSETPRLAATAAVNTGVNTGDWRGTIANDNMHWTILGLNPGGFEAHLNIDDVYLHGANKILVQTEFDTDAALAVKFQICDWISSVDVDAAADTECTGGGWRSLNTQDANNDDIIFTGNGVDSMQWHIYDGYWSNGATGGTPVSTPLVNFISNDTNRRVKVRYISTADSATNFDIDFLHIQLIIDSVYHPAGFTNLGDGTPSGAYINALGVGHTAAGQQLLAATGTVGDNIRLSVPGTSDSPADFYLSFNDVRTYAGMNAILVRAEYNCNTASNSHRPKIWNFAAGGGAGAWEDLTTASIACVTTANVQSQFALGNVTITNYVRDGEIRVGWRTLANGTQAVRLDWIYIMVGSTNADTGNCQVSFGTGTATNCSHTRDLDPLGTTNTFSNPAEDESNTFGHDFIAFDTDHDANVEEATSSNFYIPVMQPDYTRVVGVNFAGRFAAGTPGATAMTVQMGIRDYSGNKTSTAGTGGWRQIGATSASATPVFTDSMTTMAVQTYGIQGNQDDLVDSVNGRMNVRLRTTAAGTATTNTQTEWDFAMLSVQWVDTTTYVHGLVYMSDESTLGTLANGGPCDGSTVVAAVRVNGGTPVTSSCHASTAEFEIATPTLTSWGDTIAVYLTSSFKANTVYLSNGSSQVGVNLYENTLALGHFNPGPIAINHLTGYDNGHNAADMLFDANDSSPDTLITESDVELHVRAGNTFDPGGDVDTNGTDGDLHINNGATMEVDTATSTISGDVLVGSGATWRVNADTAVNGGDITMSGSSPAVTTTGGTPTVTLAGTGSIGGGTTPSITFHNLGTSGSGITSIINDATVNNNVAVAVGTTLRINANLTVNGGSLTTTSTGTIDYTSGIPVVYLNGTGNLGGGTGAITFHKLDLGDTTADTTTLLSPINVDNDLTISANQEFNVGSNALVVGSGSVANSGRILVGFGANLVQTGETTTVKSSDGAASVVLGGAGSTSFYNLNIGPDPTDNAIYSFITGGSIIVSNNLTVQDGGIGSHIFNVNSADDSVSVGGSLVIDANAVYSASSDSGKPLTIGDDFVSVGTFNHNNGKIIFNDISNVSTLSYSGSTNFGDFEVATAGKNIEFDNTNQTNILGAFTVQGTACDVDRVFLGSAVNDSLWEVNVTGSVNVNYADIEDSTAVSNILATNSTEDDFQSNVNWTVDRGECGVISMNVSSNTIGYGELSPFTERYATGDVLGSSTEVEAHTISAATNAPGGYTLLVNGDTLTAQSGAYQISQIGGTNTPSTSGIEQFGLRMDVTVGTGTVTAPYDGTGFAFDAVVVPDQAAEGLGDNVPTTYSVRYVGNIASSTEANPFDSVLTYTVTGSF